MFSGLTEFTTRERIIQSLCRLRKDYPFFAHILMHFNIPRETDKGRSGPFSGEGCDTMGVDRFGNLYYSEAFVKTLSPEELIGCLTHEALHFVKEDFFRCGTREPFIWNIASDIVINFMIQQEKMKLPDGIQTLPNTAGDITVLGKKYNISQMTTEQLYDALMLNPNIMKQTQSRPGGQSSGQSSGQGDGQGEGEDSDSDDGQEGQKGGKSGKKQKKDSSGQGDGQGEEKGPDDKGGLKTNDHHYGMGKKDDPRNQGDPGEGKPGGNKPKDGSGDKPGEGKDGEDGKDGQEGQGGSNPRSSMGDDELQQHWRQITVDAATASRGRLPGGIEGIVDKILNPVIDWRSRVLKFITNEIPVDFSNRRPGRKFYATHAWSPSIIRENLDVHISVDSSGSTYADRNYFLSEVMGIVNAYEQIKARVIFWDTRVNEENDILVTRDNKHTIPDITVKDSYGGTEMSCYARYCDEKRYKSRLHIIMTDGEIERNPTLPDGNFIFVLTKDGCDDIVKKYGPVCRLSDVNE